jgi:hypothetical protein
MPDALALLTGTEGVEQFWNEMAGGKFFVAGGDIAFDPNHSDGWIRLADPSAVDQARLFTDRVTRTIAAVLSLKNPTNTNNTPVYFDWRNFTGFIVVRNTPLPSVTVGEMVLPSGNATDFMPDCGTEQRTGISAGNLSYGVIEVGSNHLTHATLASAIGQTLGLAPFSADPYDIMGAGVYAGEFGAHPTYGLAGPRASSDSLVTLGWLDPGQIAQPEGTIGDPTTSGFVTLGPLTQAGNPNLPLRAEIGPYSFEFRIQSDAQRWDQGLPQAAAVIARSDDGETVLVNVGSSVTWGGPPASWAILGGGAVTVKEIDPGYGFVVLEFASHMGHRYIAGGQWGDGTLFTYFHGHLVRLPPGDPYGGMLAAAVQTFEFVARARESAARQRRGVRTSAGLVDDTERPGSDAGGDVRSRLP